MHTPAELVMTGASVGLVEAGIDTNTFNPAAPVAACRLCGAIYQTSHHRALYNTRQQGLPDPLKLLALVLDLNNIWRETHTTSTHTQDEIEAFAKTGFAFTPEAAKVLSPFGIIPLGNLHVDIVDAMFEADRVPDLTHLEGGE